VELGEAGVCCCGLPLLQGQTGGFVCSTQPADTDTRACASLPAAMAKPTFAARKAGASFVPSPVTATTSLVRLRTPAGHTEEVAGTQERRQAGGSGGGSGKCSRSRVPRE
jgi:hypothetical protein